MSGDDYLRMILARYEVSYGTDSPAIHVRNVTAPSLGQRADGYRPRRPPTAVAGPLTAADGSHEPLVNSSAEAHYPFGSRRATHTPQRAIVSFIITAEPARGIPAVASVERNRP